MNVCWVDVHAWKLNWPLLYFVENAYWNLYLKHNGTVSCNGDEGTAGTEVYNEQKPHKKPPMEVTHLHQYQDQPMVQLHRRMVNYELAHLQSAYWVIWMLHGTRQISPINLSIHIWYHCIPCQWSSNGTEVMGLLKQLSGSIHIYI